MKLIKGAWKILVGIKDALVLVFMLLFFSGLFMLLSAKPNVAAIHDGALVVALDGTLAEQPEAPDPFGNFGGGDVLRQHRVRDVVRALDAAIEDERVKAVVLDLDRFMGGYPVDVQAVADAVGRVRAGGKKVLAYATAYTDDSYLIAANASEIWVNPMGGTLFSGPGGSRLYYKGLIDKLGVNAHVYRVGSYKSAVEPYTRSDMSPEAREASEALYGNILSQWREAVVTARAQAKVDLFLNNPAEVVTAANGDIAQANLDNGLVDKIGDRVAFGKRVAELVGAPSGARTGNFRMIRMEDWIEANPAPSRGNAIGVITIAGEIVDGEAGPGTAGGDTISKLLLKGLAEHDFKALVVRVDSPGGSALASEQIRQAILQAKAQGLPIVTSMGSLAASGGYWVSTAGDVIFAEPNTITGSIGIFGIIPTFEAALEKVGVTTDGVATTPLTGQPDVMGGTNQATDQVIQATIEHGYRRFIGLVAQARGKTPEEVDAIGQGRVWIGGTAHQIGLVDRFGGLDEAIAEAARRAGVEADSVYPVFLQEEPSGWVQFLETLGEEEPEDDWVSAAAGADIATRIAARQTALVSQAVADVRRLAGGTAMQARCIECAAIGPGRTAAPVRNASLIEIFFARLLG
ncbi:signal peptide peptidase SppA [Stakelama tenebrarum]|uniref:Signal peptide peptidase SppA n=1 Tax=Stakelama tenebrarum TaxID=2711215 RepID=A0A6G6Y966_9SPHN|nr:signal peptide peptidase SppA [Sphingosinithalassobacter tenebrarum]QIG81475.1 signal peptide peptidase SppA [Sphingosinithalassobacter tenebrarum]